MNLKLGVDIGGTFTDFILIDLEGQRRVYKTPTTPKDLWDGLSNGLDKIADDRGWTTDQLLSNIDELIHGTTITTNAVLEKQGAKTALLTTKGFRDCLNFRRGLRRHDKMFDSSLEPPEPIVPRRRIKTVDERVNYDGEVLSPLDENEVHEACLELKDMDVEALAISFLFSFKDETHEVMAKEIASDVLDQSFISISSNLYPAPRVYERTSTTVINAYTGPKLEGYLTNLEQNLRDEGFDGVIRIMQSNGGVMTPEMAKNSPVNTVLSGPAGAPKAAKIHSEHHNLSNFIIMDMGGTSFDVTLVEDGEPTVSTENEINQWFVASPMIDVETIGAGGGSIAKVDAGGLLRVGPESAGSEPGPVCYGRGGIDPTVTDADLLLGYINPEAFGGDQFQLETRSAKEAIQDKIGDELNLSIENGAKSIHDVVNSKMADAIRVVTVREGHDPRDFAMIVGGGAGPIHACRIASELDIQTIIVPRESSVLCASGQVLTDFEHDYIRSKRADCADVSINSLQNAVTGMVDEANTDLSLEGINQSRREYKLSLELRYMGQFNEVNVPWDGNIGDITRDALESTVERFHELHARKFGYATPESPVEMLAVRLKAIGKRHVSIKSEKHQGASGSAPSQTAERKAFFGGEMRPVSVYNGRTLNSGAHIPGPSMVEHENSTIVITEEFRGKIDDLGNFIIQMDVPTEGGA